MAARVLRQFAASIQAKIEAQSSKPEVAVVSSVQLRQVVLRRVPLSKVVLRPALQAASIVVTRPARLQSRSSLPRSYALSLETPRSVLLKLMPKLKRAASACLFQRLSERLAHIQPREVAVRSVPVRPVPVPVSVASPSSVLRQRPVASRLM
jgi:hypothetical protein